MVLFYTGFINVTTIIDDVAASSHGIESNKYIFMIVYVIPSITSVIITIIYTVATTAIVFEFYVMDDPTAMTVRLVQVMTFVSFDFSLLTLIVINYLLVGLLFMAITITYSVLIFFSYILEKLYFLTLFFILFCFTVVS